MDSKNTGQIHVYLHTVFDAFCHHLINEYGWMDGLYSNSIFFNWMIT